MNTNTFELFGKDPKIQKALTVATNVAVTKSPVLIVGEVGIGKRTLGEYIHSHSSRNGSVILAVDCSLEAETVENQILGYRDAETGNFIKGALESGNGGTIILANIEGLDDSFQKRLHKILNELADYDIDVRLIATTTKNLSKLVGSGRFYRGLYTIFSHNTITLTPLRERVGDLKMLAQHFVNEFTQGVFDNVEIQDGAMNKILSHYWTHNVQELKMVIENSVNNMGDQFLTESDLEMGEKKSANMITDSDNDGIRLMSLKEAEKLLIKKALIHTSENRTQAAKILGVSIRTLRNKINEYRGNGSAYFINLR